MTDVVAKVQALAQKSLARSEIDKQAAADQPVGYAPRTISRLQKVRDAYPTNWPGIDSSKWFDRNGDPVMSSTLDECGKRLSDCKLRFGANNELDYGGFPSLGRNG